MATVKALHGGFGDISVFFFFMPDYRYLYFTNRAANLVEICNVYANQMVIKVAYKYASTSPKYF